MPAPNQPRPKAIRLIQWVVAGLGLWNLGRALALGRQLKWLDELPLAPDPRLRFMIALIWANLFIAAAIALWLGCLQSRWILPLLIAAYGVYEVGMIALFSTARPAQLPVLFYSLLTLLATWALYRPASKAYFHSIRIRRSPIRATHESQD